MARDLGIKKSLVGCIPCTNETAGRRRPGGERRECRERERPRTLVRKTAIREYRQARLLLRAGNISLAKAQSTPRGAIPLLRWRVSMNAFLGDLGVFARNKIGGKYYGRMSPPHGRL